MTQLNAGRAEPSRAILVCLFHTWNRVSCAAHGGAGVVLVPGLPRVARVRPAAPEPRRGLLRSLRLAGAHGLGHRPGMDSHRLLHWIRRYSTCKRALYFRFVFFSSIDMTWGLFSI